MERRRRFVHRAPVVIAGSVAVNIRVAMSATLKLQRLAIYKSPASFFLLLYAVLT